MQILSQIGLVALGSALGGLLRWGVGVGCAQWLGTGFPWGTSIINISACLFLGWFSTIVGERLVIGDGWFNADNLKLFFAVGFTGAYSTFSTFEYESNKLLEEGDGLKAMTYMIGSVVLGLVAVQLGIRLARTK